MATEMITFEVRCMGCGELVASPNEADMELFRLGIHTHNDASCIAMADEKLSRRTSALPQGGM